MKKQKIISALEEMLTDELIEVYNEYADINRYERIYRIGELDDLIQYDTASETIRECELINLNDDYIIFVNNWESFSYNQVLEHISIDEIASYIINSENGLSNSDIQEILNDDEVAE